MNLSNLKRFKEYHCSSDELEFYNMAQGMEGERIIYYGAEVRKFYRIKGEMPRVSTIAVAVDIKKGETIPVSPIK